MRTTLGFLPFSFDFTVMGTEFVTNNNVNKTKLAENYFESISYGSTVGRTMNEMKVPYRMRETSGDMMTDMRTGDGHI